MIKVYQLKDSIITVSVNDKLKEVTVASSAGVQLYSAPKDEDGYGSMGAYVNSWLRTVEGLKPVVVMG